jgi:hypothetical protein
MESSRKLWGSSGSCRYTVKAYPPYRFSPSSVPNHMNPRLSCKMLVTVLWESPSSVVILPKRIPEEIGACLRLQPGRRKWTTIGGKARGGLHTQCSRLRTYWDDQPDQGCQAKRRQDEFHDRTGRTPIIHMSCTI